LSYRGDHERVEITCAERFVNGRAQNRKIPARCHRGARPAVVNRAGRGGSHRVTSGRSLADTLQFSAGIRGRVV